MAVVAISALTASITIVTGDVLPAVIGGVTKKITAGNLRAQMFGFGASDPLSCGPVTVTGNSTITGTLSGITTFTCTTLAATSLSTSAAATIGSTLSVSGAITASSGILVTGGAFAPGKLYKDAAVGTTLTCITGGTYDFGLYTPGGAAILTVASGTNELATAAKLTVGGQLVLSSSLGMTTAVSKLIPGATSFSHRNNADTFDNLLITDAGVVATRGAITTAGAAGDVILPNAASIRGVNAAAGTTKKLLRFNAADRVEICPDGDDLTFGGSLPALGGGAAPTLGTIGGTGPAAAAQFGWMKFYTSGGTAFYCPTWR